MDSEDDSLPRLPAPINEANCNLDSSGPVTFKDLGIIVRPTTRRTIVGKVQTWHGLKIQEKLFLLIVVLSFLTSMGLTIERLKNLSTTSDDYTLAIILCVATVFSFYYAVGGIFLERPFELLVCISSTVIVAIYTVLNFFYGTPGIVKLVRMVLALVYGIPLCFTGFRIAFEYYKSRDLILRTVGANMRLQKACGILFVTLSLLGFDLQLSISMFIFVMTDGVQLDFMEKIILGVGVPFSVLWLILGYFSLRLESKATAVIFVLLCWVEPGYVIYKFTEVYQEDKILRYSTLACGVASLGVRLFLIIFTIIAVLNFNLGLKDKVYGRQTPRSGSVASG